MKRLLEDPCRLPNCSEASSNDSLIGPAFKTLSQWRGCNIEIFDSHTLQGQEEVSHQREKNKMCLKLSWRERIFVSRCPDGIRKLYLDSESISEVVYLLKKIENAKIVEYLVCRTLAFHSFVLG